MTFKKFSATLALASVALAGPALASNQAPHDFAHNVTCNDCHIPSGSLTDPLHLVQGTATGGGTTSLVDSSKTLTTNAWAGGVITFTSGSLPSSADGGMVSATSNNGQFRTITANDGTSFGWTDALPFPVAPGDTYTLNLVTYDDIEVKCKTCHSPTGVASDHATGGLHYTGAHSPTIGCGKCHEPHNIDPNSGWSGDAPDGGSAGANLIRTGIRRPDGTIGNIVYTPGSGNTPSVLVQPAGNGVCQTCHTTTKYYLNDGTQMNHGFTVGSGAVSSCIDCHSHEAQFFPASQDNGSGDHFDPDAGAYTTTSVGSGACVRCHTEQGFQDYIGVGGAAMNTNDTFLAKGTTYPVAPMTCQACHNSVSDPTLSTAGLTSVEFVSLNKVSGLDKATALCSQCHQGRESTASVNAKIAGNVASASQGLALVTLTAAAAGTTTTIQAKIAMTASQYKGYTLVATNNANQGLNVTVADNTSGTTSTAGTITLATPLTAATSGAVTGPPAIPADTFTIWPTATGGGADTLNSSGTAIRQGSVIRGTTLVDSNRAWTANQWAGYYVFIQTDPNPGSPNAGLYRQITANDATSLTVANAAISSGMPFPAVIAAGTRYQILVPENTSVLDAIAPSISFTNSHYLPASAILHGADAMIGYQNPRNMANSSVPTATSSTTVTLTGTATATGTATGTVTATNTTTSTSSSTPNVAAARSYTGKNFHGVSQDSCVSCHDPHTLAVTVSTTTCGRCHFTDNGVTPVANLTDLENSRQFGFDGDIDGDGNLTEGLKAEVDGLAAVLFSAIRSYATNVTGHGICYTAGTNPYWFINNDATDTTGTCTTVEADPCNVYSSVTSTTKDANGIACVSAKQHTGYYTPRLMRAAFNYQIYVKEPGAWAHNPRYIIEMLYDALVDLNMGLPLASQVGYACIDSGGNRTSPTSSRTCASGTTLAFTPRRAFLASTHFDGMSNAFRNWDTKVPSAGMVQYPCLRCHSGQKGFEQFLAATSPSYFYDQTSPAASPVVPTQVMECYTCHQPLATDTNMQRMRDMSGTAAGGVRFPGHAAGGTLGAGYYTILDKTKFGDPNDMICSACHGGRDINGAAYDGYLQGVWSGLDVNGQPLFGGGVSIVNNGSGKPRLTGLPAYLPPVLTSSNATLGSPANWLSASTNTAVTTSTATSTNVSTASCSAVGKYLTLSNSAGGYNGTFKITACGNGTADLDNNAGTLTYSAAETNNGAISWAAFAASAKNLHDIQGAARMYGATAHEGYEYAGKSYFGTKQHNGAIAKCTDCHSPKGTRHTFDVADSVNANLCSPCHTGTNYTTWVSNKRTIASGPGYDSDPTTTTLAAELASFRNGLGAAMNAYASNAGVYVINGSAVSSTATGGDTLNLIDTSRTGTNAWTNNQFVGYTLSITSGTLKGKTATITANTSTQVTVGTAFSAAITSGTTYAIILPQGNLCWNETKQSFYAQLGNTSGMCDSANVVGWVAWAGYDPKLGRANYNMIFAGTSSDPGGWAHNFDYLAELLYDSAVDLGTATPTGPAGPLTRP